MGAGEEDFIHFGEGQLCVVDGGGGFCDALLLFSRGSSGLCGIEVFFAGIFDGSYGTSIGGVVSRSVALCPMAIGVFLGEKETG